jgi:hypothetical protein
MGDPPDELDLEGGPRIIGEYFNDLEFWGADGLANISAELLKNQNTININTSVYSRNW